MSWDDDFFEIASIDVLLNDFNAVIRFSLLTLFVLSSKSSKLDDNGYWRFCGYE